MTNFDSRESIIQEWHKWRKYIADGGTGSWPRDAFETLLDYLDASKPVMTDLDLPPAYRTQANLQKAKYFEAYKELVKANKGLRRLRRKVDRLERDPNKPVEPTMEGT